LPLNLLIRRKKCFEKFSFYEINKIMSQFDVLYEAELERYQMGGLLVGDCIKFRKNALKHQYIASRAQSFVDMVKACMEPSFDLNLRIGALKSIYPSTSLNAGNTAPEGYFADIYIEYAPGLFRNPITVPVEVIEVVDIGNERGPIPKSLRRPNNVHGPKEHKTKSDDVNAQTNLTTQDTKMPGANKWDDTKPGGGNFKI
jgi:hypothetical protein